MIYQPSNYSFAFILHEWSLRYDFIIYEWLFFWNRVSLVTRTYYGVICNGSMLRPIDRPAPSMDTYMRNLSLDLYEGETVKLRYLLLQDPRSASNITEKLVRAITIAWNNVPGTVIKNSYHQQVTLSTLLLITLLTLMAMQFILEWLHSVHKVCYGDLITFHNDFSLYLSSMFQYV